MPGISLARKQRKQDRTERRSAARTLRRELKLIFPKDGRTVPQHFLLVARPIDVASKRHLTFALSELHLHRGSDCGSRAVGLRARGRADGRSGQRTSRLTVGARKLDRRI